MSVYGLMPNNAKLKDEILHKSATIYNTYDTWLKVVINNKEGIFKCE